MSHNGSIEAISKRAGALGVQKNKLGLIEVEKWKVEQFIL